MNFRAYTRALSGIACVVLILTLCGRSSSHVGGPAGSTTISDLAWMSGSWQSGPDSHARVEEYWTRPLGGSMIGMSRTIVEGKTVEFEFLRVEQRGDAIYYVASPEGRCPGTDFKLTRLSGQVAVFENPEHDFPKRIIYQKKTDGSLIASIDGGEGTKSQVFAYLPQSK